MPTGEPSGLYVVDIDGPEGRASLAELEKEHGPIPLTKASTTGRGTHYLFKATPGIRNSQGTIGKGIDTRGDGGYIVAPPSIHPNGHRYKWGETGSEMAELPDWLRPANHKPKPIPAPAGALLSHVPKIGSENRYARASAYLAAMPGAVEGAGGHNALYAAATAMVNGFELTHAEAFDILANEYNPRCSPPWDLSNTSDRKEFDRKIQQAATQPHSNPRGYLLAGDTNEAEAELGRASAAAMLANHMANQVAPAPKPAKTTPFPKHLLTPPGKLGELCAWMNQTAWIEQPILALAASIAFCGALFGRKIQTASRLRTNVYVIGVAESGAGKDHARDCIKELCEYAGVTDELNGGAKSLLGGEDFASDAGLLAAIKQSPSILFLLDEVGHLIANVNSAQAASYQKSIATTLTKLFTSSKTTYRGKQYAEKDRVDILQPNACVYGTTVAEVLYGGISTSEIRDGFLGRVLIFELPEEEPEEAGNTLTEPPADLIKWVAEWRAYEPSGGDVAKALTNTSDGPRPTPATYSDSPEATQQFAALKAHATRERKKLKTSARAAMGLGALWARAGENARKLSLIYAASQGNEPPYNAATVISGDAAQWGCDLAKYIVTNIVTTLGQTVFNSKAEEHCNMVLKAIRSAKGEATRTHITRYTRSLTPREREDALNSLITAEEISRIDKVTKGRTSTAYQLINAA